MLDAYSFDCPKCGASLAPQGESAQVRCEYCGKIVVVPDDLRAHPPAPLRAANTADLSAIANERAPRVGETERPQKRSGPFSSIGSTLMVILFIGLCIGLGALTDSDVQKSIAAVVAPTATPLPVNRPLDAILPREMQYAGLVFSIKQAAISNQDPAATDNTRKYRSDRAYATVDLVIKSAVNTKSVYLDPNVLRLQLGDGKQYQPSAGWHTNYDPQSTIQTKLEFAVPIDATWKGAQLILTEPKKEPAVLALDGNVAAPRYPIIVKNAGQATVAQITYLVASASLDLDSNGARAETGKRFATFSLHITNRSPAAGGEDILPNNFRLIVDGDSIAPLDAPIELLNPSSSLDTNVIFVIPANYGKLELQVGYITHETAKFPIALKAGP
jgi:hypothetical protein